jgi:hypothetical protein
MSRALAFSKYTISIAPIHECFFPTSAKTQKRASRLHEPPEINWGHYNIGEVVV